MEVTMGIRKFYENILGNRSLLCITILACIVRAFLLPVISGDYIEYLHPWFLELKENNIPLLNCYCDVEKVAEGELDITLIPFEETNPFVWKKQVDGVWVSAF